MGKKGLKFIVSFLMVSVFIFMAATLKVMSMPGTLKVTENINIENYQSSKLKSNFLYKVESQNTIKNKSKEVFDKLDVSVKLFGFIPVKKMTVTFAPQIKVIPGGQPVGVKLNTEGVIVVGFSDVETASGKKKSPSAASGIEMGDSILEINGVKINGSQDVVNTINKNGAKVINIKIRRKENEQVINITPIETLNKNEFKIGLWVRDSTSGVGTLTFYEAASGKFGALGHPINDVDTGILMPIRDGSIYNAKIVSIEQGMRGKPGELRGMFSEEDECGRLEKNTLSGIFGKMTSVKDKNIYNQPVPIARQSEIKEGAAKILTALEGDEIKEYDIYIEKLTQQSKPNSKSMIIRVTDKELLTKTGGIVQGMSGSPILQDGKIVGAVTHVFVNRPDMGYGIYIEWMLKESGIEI